MKKFANFFSTTNKKNSSNVTTNTNKIEKHDDYSDIEYQSYRKGLQNSLDYVETFFEKDVGFYIEESMADPIDDIASKIISGTINSEFMDNLQSVHSLTSAIKLTLLKREAIIPYNYYDHFLSPMADIDSLLSTLPARNVNLLHLLIRHFLKLSKFETKRNFLLCIAECIGVHILRPKYVDKSSEAFEMQLRANVFLKIIESIGNKNELTILQQDTSVPIQKNIRSNSLSLSPQTKQPFSKPVKQIEVHSNQPLTNLNSNLNSNNNSNLNSNPQSIQDRSVKIVFLNPQNPPTQNALRSNIEKFGKIIHVFFNFFFYLIIYNGV
jgi:hypothetical protein